MNLYVTSHGNTVVSFTDKVRDDQRLTQTSLSELEKATERTKEELEDQLYQLQQQIGTLDQSLHRTLETDRAQIETCLKSLEEAQKVRASRARIVVENNDASGPNTRLIAGTDMQQLAVDLSVIGNRAESGASMAAGSYTPETVQALLRQSSTSPNAAFIINAMQTNTFDSSFLTTSMPGVLGASPERHRISDTSGEHDEILANTTASTTKERTSITRQQQKPY